MSALSKSKIDMCKYLKGGGILNNIWDIWPPQ